VVVNFCVVLGCSGRSGGGGDGGCCLIPAIVSGWKPKKQALSVECRAAWLARFGGEDVAADAAAFGRVCGDHFVSGG